MHIPRKSIWHPTAHEVQRSSLRCMTEHRQNCPERVERGAGRDSVIGEPCMWDSGKDEECRHEIKKPEEPGEELLPDVSEGTVRNHM